VRCGVPSADGLRTCPCTARHRVGSLRPARRTRTPVRRVGGPFRDGPRIRASFGASRRRPVCDVRIGFAASRFHRPRGVAAQLSGDSATRGRHHVARPIVRGCVATQRQRRGKSVVAAIGGPPAITEFARSIGDDRTRLDRWEVELNTAVPGDPRDTSTPRALGGGIQKLLTGTILSESQRRQLEEWTRGNATSDLSMRAGLPAGWTTANKTGTGDKVSSKAAPTTSESPTGLTISEYCSR
jgi:hypothetical protein